MFNFKVFDMIIIDYNIIKCNYRLYLVLSMGNPLNCLISYLKIVIFKEKLRRNK